MYRKMIPCVFPAPDGIASNWKVYDGPLMKEYKSSTFLMFNTMKSNEEMIIWMRRTFTPIYCTQLYKQHYFFEYSETAVCVRPVAEISPGIR